MLFLQCNVLYRCHFKFNMRTGNLNLKQQIKEVVLILYYYLIKIIRLKLILKYTV